MISALLPLLAIPSVLCCLSLRSFGEESELMTGQRGMDRVRNTVVGKLNFKLTYFEEVFTSQHWMMRIYRWAHAKCWSGASRQAAQRALVTSDCEHRLQCRPEAW